MSKNKILVPLIGCLALGVSSCASDEEAEVYLTVMPGTGDYPTSLAPKDNYYSFLDEFIQTDKAPITGEYAKWKQQGGYVDLGLSVKWASFNLNPKATADGNSIKSFDDIYKEVCRSMGLITNKYGDLPIGTSSGADKYYIMGYEEFLKRYNYTGRKNSGYEYEEYCENMKKAYEKAVVEYNNYLLQTKYAELFNRGSYHWGDIDSYAVQGDYKDLPMDIAGTKYDLAAVNLGDGWRMPTKAEFQELLDKCEWDYKSEINGYIVTGPSGKRIFISVGKQSDTTDYPYIFLTSERTGNWGNGVGVYAVNITDKQIVNHSSGRRATIRPVYTK